MNYYFLKISYAFIAWKRVNYRNKRSQKNILIGTVAGQVLPEKSGYYHLKLPFRRHLPMANHVQPFPSANK
jgi:hypothetical protein